MSTDHIRLLREKLARQKAQAASDNSNQNHPPLPHTAPLPPGQPASAPHGSAFLPAHAIHHPHQPPPPPPTHHIPPPREPSATIGRVPPHLQQQYQHHSHHAHPISHTQHPSYHPQYPSVAPPVAPPFPPGSAPSFHHVYPSPHHSVHPGHPPHIHPPPPSHLHPHVPHQPPLPPPPVHPSNQATSTYTSHPQDYESKKRERSIDHHADMLAPHQHHKPKPIQSSQGMAATSIEPQHKHPGGNAHPPLTDLEKERQYLQQREQRRQQQQDDRIAMFTNSAARILPKDFDFKFFSPLTLSSSETDSVHSNSNPNGNESDRPTQSNNGNTTHLNTNPPDTSIAFPSGAPTPNPPQAAQINTDNAIPPTQVSIVANTERIIAARLLKLELQQYHDRIGKHLYSFSNPSHSGACPGGTHPHQHSSSKTAQVIAESKLHRWDQNPNHVSLHNNESKDISGDGQDQSSTEQSQESTSPSLSPVDITPAPHHTGLGFKPLSSDENPASAIPSQPQQSSRTVSFIPTQGGTNLLTSSSTTTPPTLIHSDKQPHKNQAKYDHHRYKKNHSSKQQKQNAIATISNLVINGASNSSNSNSHMEQEVGFEHSMSKGYQMLAKMGWDGQQGLGTIDESTGVIPRTQIVEVYTRGQEGLSANDTEQQQQLQEQQQRTQRLQYNSSILSHDNSNNNETVQATQERVRKNLETVKQVIEKHSNITDDDLQARLDKMQSKVRAKYGRR